MLIMNHGTKLSFNAKHYKFARAILPGLTTCHFFRNRQTSNLDCRSHTAFSSMHCSTPTGFCSKLNDGDGLQNNGRWCQESVALTNLVAGYY
ncbi:unnamed protein product [Calypogeia fissa]